MAGVPADILKNPSDAEGIKGFLRNCGESAGQAYNNFKLLLQKLEDPATRAPTRAFLDEVDKHVQKEESGIDCLAKYHFRLHELALCYEGWENEAERQKMKLLELAGIFVPEEWSFTFFEGLSRYPESEFRDRDVCELGCGNGWVSLALAERWCARKVIGLDINPRAIKCAQINLFLNALNPDGSPCLDSEGKSLLDRVEFHESDLLAHCTQNKIVLDRIVGCIPQILNPDPAAMSKLVSENASEEFLYSLSNYCSMQGFVEDQFGLGLIARALEESIQVIKPSGSIIMNMGGRPGQAVLERLYERRGFNIRKVWQTRVGQAPDTDILALVEIERNSRHKFEFFMGPVGVDQPISAKTAYAFAKAGGKIYHGLSVFEARMRQPNQVKAIFEFLRDPDFSGTRNALDLSFPSEAVADEKIAFLAHLSKYLQTSPSFPYEQAAGSDTFRHHLATFLRLYFRVPLNQGNLVIAPSRPVLIENVITIYAPRLALVDGSLTAGLPRKWLATQPLEEGGPRQSGDSGPVVIEAPSRADLVLKLIKALKPELVVVALPDYEVRTATAFEQLLDATAEVGARLLVDLSDHLDLSSLPGANGVLEFMASKPLPAHAAIICSLVKNQVYSDLRIAFAVSENLDFLRGLTMAGELTFNRPPVLAQLYYQVLLHELLAFQIPDRRPLHVRPPASESPDVRSRFIGFTENARRAFSHPALQHLEPLDGLQTVPMNMGENALPTPTPVKRFAFESFARQNISDAESDPRPEILEILQQRLGARPEKAHEVHLGDGVAPLVARLLAACAEEGGTLFYPSGMYGAFTATAQLYNAKAAPIKTDVVDSFKLTPEQLRAALSAKPLKPWLALVAPTVNPTGAIYTPSELSEILAVAKEFGAKVLIDTTFSGLNFEPAATTPRGPGAGGVNKGTSLGALLEPSGEYAVAVLGGIAKEFSAGGLRFGYAVTQDAFLSDALKQGVLSNPHQTLRYAAKKILSARVNAEEPLTHQLANQRRVLQERVHQLSRLLTKSGWEVLKPYGGLFLIATPAAHLAKKFTYKMSTGLKTVQLDADNIREALYYTTGIQINSSSWMGIDKYCRFVLSIDEEKFQRVPALMERFVSCKDEST